MNRIHDKKDDEFVTAYFDANRRNRLILSLLFVRSLVFVALGLNAFLMLLILFIGIKGNNPTQQLEWGFALAFAFYLYLDFQIKFLKTAEALENRQKRNSQSKSADSIADFNQA